MGGGGVVEGEMFKRRRDKVMTRWEDKSNEKRNPTKGKKELSTNALAL
jgi:hypothetical protein